MTKLIGSFTPFLLKFTKDHSTVDGVYKDGGLDVKQQVKAILDHAKTLLAAGAKGVAITYSANYGQTQKIHNTYANNGWNTQTSGINQAEVITAMEDLMGTDYADIQMNVRIAPITTMSYTGTLTAYQIVLLDIIRIKTDLLDQGWDVLGWRNQSTAANRFAVGGGVAGGLPPDIDNLIQSGLNLYAALYASGN